MSEWVSVFCVYIHNLAHEMLYSILHFLEFHLLIYLELLLVAEFTK